MAAKDALAEMIERIEGGAVCFQEAGWGPFVFIIGDSSKHFSARTARKGERMGLLALDWCTQYNKWRWNLTTATMAKGALCNSTN